MVIEDHSVHGGLGGAVAEAYARWLRMPVARIGIPDTFTESDDYPRLREKYGISVLAIRGAVAEVLESNQ